MTTWSDGEQIYQADDEGVTAIPLSEVFPLLMRTQIEEVD